MMKKEELKELMNKSIDSLYESLGFKDQVKRGDTVSIAGYEWIVLKIEESKVFCVMKDFKDKRKFDAKSNDYKTSSIREYLSEELQENLYPITTNLLSLDGQKEYGILTEDKIALLTLDDYRENRDILPNTDKYWWLATPWSTKCNKDERWVCCVAPNGNVNGDCCDIDGVSVRPFCIFDSSIFEA